MKFTDLVTQISGIDGAARLSAGQTLQQILSLRNWLIGAYVVEFEQAGEDRAAYGEALVRTLAKELAAAGCRSLSWRNLNNFRQLAFAYPGLDPAGLGQSLAFPRIVQTSAQFDHSRSLRPTSAGSASGSTNRQTAVDFGDSDKGRGGALEVNSYTSPDVRRICRPPQRFRELVVVLAQYLNLRYCPAFSRGR